MSDYNRENGEIMNQIAELRSKRGTKTLVGYDFDSSLDELVAQGAIDCPIISSEDGFSPLGMWMSFFADELGIRKYDIGELANLNRFDNDKISLVGLPSRRATGNLKGVVLAAGETSKCYEQFAPAYFGRPYRDFYYNVAYESIHYAAHVLKAEKLAISHLSGSGHFHENIAICIAEALGHFCDQADSPPIRSFLFVGCCINPDHLSGIERLNSEGAITRHRDIRTRATLKNGFDVISLDWREPPRR